MMKKTNKNWNNIAAYLAGEMNDLQSEQFLENANNNMQLNKDLKLMSKSWKNIDSQKEKKYMNTERAWENLHYKMRSEGLLDETNNPIPFKKNTAYLLRVAAVIAIVLTIGIPSTIYSFKHNSSTGSMVKHQAENGVLTVDLPDGSRVYLNEGANLEYSKSFEENRNVNLEGEGFFKVMSDPKRPFKVNSGKVIITVLGTSFNVREANKNNVEVYVESGQVQVDITEKDESLILVPGEIVVANENITRTTQTNPNYLAWKTKEFKFVDESLNKILKILSEAYHVEVITKDLSLKNMNLTSTYNDQSFDAILSTICLAHQLNYKKEGKVYILYPN